MLNNTTAMLTTLRGMPLTILVALFLSPVLPIGESELAAMIGINQKTVRGHLNFLKGLGLVVRNGRYSAWSLGDGAHQLPLPLVPLSNGSCESNLSNGKSYLSQDEDPKAAVSLSGKSYLSQNENPDETVSSSGKSYLSPSSSSSFKDQEEEGRILEEEEKGGNGKSYLSPQKQQEAKQGLIPAFQAAGIGMNMWGELAEYEWVTAEFVAAHSVYAKRHREPPNYVIQRLRCGDLVPETAVSDAGCPTCGSSRYWANDRCLKCAGIIKS